MPELPDIKTYQKVMETHLLGQRLLKIRLGSPFLLRSVTPPLSLLEQREVKQILRLGKRLVLGLEGSFYLVLHLMIVGRLHWKPPGTSLPRKSGLALFDFDHGSLLLTESSTRKRASLYAVHGAVALAAHDPGGLDLLTTTLAEFHTRLNSGNNTLKRALTDPKRFDGIGNAYSDEILHAAGLSPLQLTGNLSDLEVERLFLACQSTLRLWIDRLLAEAKGGFPKRVTAFHSKMAVHGKYRQPCPTCHSPIQRIVQGEREVNYCPTCQTGGKVLADRAWSKLLKKDWPQTLEGWEDMIKPPPNPSS